MSGALPDTKKGYKLVPQHESDESDLSEDELYSLYKDGFQVITKSRIYSSPIRHNVNTEDTVDNEMETNNLETDVKASSIFPSNDEASSSWRTNSMSSERKIWFVSSILVCILVPIGFLFSPCEWTSCQCIGDVLLKPQWQKVYTNIEIKGPIVQVFDSKTGDYKLLLTASGSKLADSPVIRSDLISAQGGDLIMLNSSTGNEIWRKHFSVAPVESNCSLISLFKKENTECIVVGAGCKLTVISSATGRIIWSIPLCNNKSNGKQLQFPVLIPDLNNDDVPELVSYQNLESLVIISGRDGKIVKEIKTIYKCAEINNLYSSTSMVVGYTCIFRNRTEKHMLVSLKNHMNLTAPSIDWHTMLQHAPPRPSKQYLMESLKMMMTNRNISKLESSVSARRKSLPDNGLQMFGMQIMMPVRFHLENAGLYGMVVKEWNNMNPDNTIHLPNIESIVKEIQERVFVVFNSSETPTNQEFVLYERIIGQLHVSNGALQPSQRNQDSSLLIIKKKGGSALQLIVYRSGFEKTGDESFTLKSYVSSYDVEKTVMTAIQHNLLIQDA